MRFISWPSEKDTCRSRSPEATSELASLFTAPTERRSSEKHLDGGTEKKKLQFNHHQSCLKMRSLTSSLPFTYTSSSSSFTLYKRFSFLNPSSSLKQTNKKQQKQSLRRLFSPKSSDDDEDAKSSSDEDDSDGDAAAIKGTIIAGVLLVGTVGGFAGVGYVYRDQINTFLTQFSTLIEGSCWFLLPNSFYDI